MSDTTLTDQELGQFMMDMDAIEARHAKCDTCLAYGDTKPSPECAEDSHMQWRHEHNLDAPDEPVMIDLLGYDPTAGAEYWVDQSLIQPTGINLHDGSAEAVYLNDTPTAYTSLSELLAAHTLDVTHMAEWLGSEGREADGLALQLAEQRGAEEFAAVLASGVN